MPAPGGGSDSNEPRRREWQLSEIEEPFRLIANTTSEVLWIVSSYLSRPVYVSPAFERVWGKSCEALYRDPRAFLEPIHPEDLPLVLHDLEQGKSFDHEYRLVRPDGSVRWIWDRGWPARGQDGQIAYFVGIAQDITERKRAEVELRDSEARFRATFEQAAVGLAHVAIDGRFLRVNQRLSDITGYGREELQKLRLQDVSPLDPADRRAMGRLLRGEIHTHTSERRLVRKDGKEAFIEVTSSLVHTASGAPDYFMGVVIDVSGRREIEAQLRHAQKMEAIGVLAGGVAHDFNNMLQAIVLDAELASLSGGDSLAVQDCVNNIKAVADRAGRLARQLLLFSRRELMQRQPLEINAAATNLGTMLERILGEDVRLELRLAPDAGRIDADPGMIDQVLMNLAVNARDAMPRGGTLTIETELVRLDGADQHLRGSDAKKEFVRITVRDTGCGIRPEVLPRIFEPFFTTKEPGRGTGLGLATVFGIVEQHSGWTEVESEVGRGTTFRVFLPSYPSDLRGAFGSVRSPARAGGETILLVEDDAIVRSSVRAILAHHGYKLVEAATGFEALQRWDEIEGKVDVVLTDLVMPGGMDGRELGALLVARRPALRVVYASGHTGEFAGRDLPLGPNEHFLSKPMTADRLLYTLRTCLEGL
jgi:PAS domain S-box-containing protein